MFFWAGLVDEAADEEEISYVSLHYFGKFETVDGLLVYNRGLMITFPFNRKSLKFELLLSYAEDMYHVERGHCRGDYSYKMHWLVPGKKLSEGLQFFLMIQVWRRWGMQHLLGHVQRSMWRKCSCVKKQ